MTGVTSAEFLSKIPKKSKEDHEWDKKEMQKAFSKLKDIELKPKMDLEEAIARIKKLHS